MLHVLHALVDVLLFFKYRRKKGNTVWYSLFYVMYTEAHASFEGLALLSSDVSDIDTGEKNLW